MIARTGMPVVLAFAFLAARANAIEHVVFERDGVRTTIGGRVLVTAEDGGLLVESRDGRLWTVQPSELTSRAEDDEPFTPLGADEAAETLLGELPEGFQVLKTQNYVICFNTSRAYAEWCGALFEQLHRAFTNYWTRQGFDLRPAEFPLVALIFADRDSYAKYAQGELGDAAGSIVGYYSLATNRMTMYDLTGVETLRQPGDRRSSRAQINEMLARPDAARTVATVIHEATHQLAFNSGLQTRYADIPLWVSEGIAVYFETPSANSARGWRSIGNVHPLRLSTFQQYAPLRPADSLATLVADDSRFRDPAQAGNAYAEAWAFNYFLLRQKRDQYMSYLRKLAEKKQLLWDDREARLREFSDSFGDLRELDQEFLRYMSKVRASS